jgi:hypothetical protein
LSRDRRIITRKRNKLTVVAVAGALSVATVATAAAAVWPSGAPAGKAGTAFAALSQSAHRPADRQPSPPAGNRAVAHARSVAGHQAVLTARAQQQPAMHRAVVTQPSRHQSAKRQPAATHTTAASQAAARQSQQAVQPATQQAAVASPTPPPSATPTTTPAPAASGSPQSIAQSMLESFGWSPGQFSCLEPLWQHESSWSVSASNSSTGAYGIPQAVPGSKMASAGLDWKTNPSTQIKWGLGYIKDTYGSPCAAWSHEQADGWY